MRIVALRPTLVPQHLIGNHGELPSRPFSAGQKRIQPFKHRRLKLRLAVGVLNQQPGAIEAAFIHLVDGGESPLVDGSFQPAKVVAVHGSRMLFQGTVSAAGGVDATAHALVIGDVLGELAAKRWLFDTAGFVALRSFSPNCG